jgi:hypothetical protein
MLAFFLPEAPLRLIPLVFLVAACSEPVAVHTPSMSVTGTDPTNVGDDDDNGGADNHAPIADAGEDFTAYVADQVELDGSASYDPDGDGITYEWTMTSRPNDSAASLINAARVNPSFFADRPGFYVIELAVSDAQSVATDEVQIEITAPNDGPVANAGPDQTVGVGDRVVLNGSASYDPDADPLSFQWRFTAAPAGSNAYLDADTTALPQFTADLAGVYVVQLEVSDGLATSTPDQVTITASDAGGTTCLSCTGADDALERKMYRGQVASAGFLGVLLALRRRR